MLRKMFITAGGLFLSLLMFATSASASTVTADVSSGDSFAGIAMGDVIFTTIRNTDGLNSSSNNTGLFEDHTYTFTAGLEDIYLKWVLDVNVGDTDSSPDTGIKNLIFSWDNGVTSIFTDENGKEIGSSPLYFTILAGTSVILTVSGDMFGLANSEYSFTMSAVPLPPAVIAFASAMFGIGFLGRRKKKLAAEQA